MARPKKKIDKAQFESLLSLQCTLVEVSGFFSKTLNGCSEDTIERWCKETYGENFAEVYKKKSASGKISLRRKQFEVAMKGNPTMLIWLGRNMLNQTDQIAVSIEDKSNGKLVDLIEGLKENDIHSETTTIDEEVADKPPTEN